MSAQGMNKPHSLVVLVVLLGLGLATLLGYYFVYLPHLQGVASSTHKTMVLMDTIVDVRVDGINSEELVDQVFSIMEELEQTLSRFIKDSEVSEINNRAGQWVRVSPITLELIELGIKMGELTNGTFDITIGSILDLWGFGTAQYSVPTQAEIDSKLQNVDYKKVEINKITGEVRLPVGAVLDLGGIAKGYIIEAGIKFLGSATVERAIINGGGDISVIGRRPDDLPWRVGVQDPENPSEIRWILPLDDESVVTSGDYQRYFTYEDQRYHHIIDPRTGFPARELRSVTIVGESITICDALSTAVFVLGQEEGRSLIENWDNVEAIIVSSTETWISSGLVPVVN